MGIVKTRVYRCRNIQNYSLLLQGIVSQHWIHLLEFRSIGARCGPWLSPKLSMTYQKLTNAMLSLTDGDPIAIPATRNTTLEVPILMEGKVKLLYPLGEAGREPSKLRTSRPPSQIHDVAAGEDPTASTHAC